MSIVCTDPKPTGTEYDTNTERDPYRRSVVFRYMKKMF